MDKSFCRLYITWLNNNGKFINESEMKELKNKIDLLIFESI